MSCHQKINAAETDRETIKCPGDPSIADCDSREIPESVASQTTAINHRINNALAVIIGNLQCLRWEKGVTDRKALSRLRRIEAAALMITTANEKLQNLTSRKQSQSTTVPAGTTINSESCEDA
ncbi:MAG: hypothetical protein ABII79_13470 [bacterium]